MRTQVAMRSGAGDLLLQPPYERKIGIDDPILQEPAAEMLNLLENAFLNQLLGKLYGGSEAVIEADHVLHACLPAACSISLASTSVTVNGFS